MNEQDIPIEISAIKLLEWLESRKIVQKNWPTKIREIRGKISNALNDMPVHADLVKLLSGAYINYFHCLQIIEILKTTEADTKSLFGRYGSQRMTDWQEIVKLYEKDNVYLAEAAQILQRNNSEVPGVRKQRSKIAQLIDDTQHRIKDLIKSEENLTTERATICQQLGIKGINLRDEFVERIKELPKLYEEVAGSVPNVAKAIQLYIDFSENSENLPLLRHIIKNGNTTVYEYIYNEAPLSVEEPQLQLHLTVESVGNQEDADIDFGNIPHENDAAIDFGEVNIENISLESDEIDWGEVVEIPVADVSLEESGIVVAGSGLDGGVARGEEAYTLLDNTIHRDQFIDEVYELEAFLQMRQHELKSDQSNSFLFSIIEGNTKHDSNTVTLMLANVQNLLSLYSSETIDHLHRLKHSAKYGDILAAKLQQILTAVEKTRATREVLKAKIEILTKDKIGLKPVIINKIESSKTLQQQIEKNISKRYKDRAVYIYGGVDFDPLD